MCSIQVCPPGFVTSFSTEMFLNALERFINVRGRPHQIYSDNGSNFVGAVSLFSKLNWNRIEALANTQPDTVDLQSAIGCMVGWMVGAAY